MPRIKYLFLFLLMVAYFLAVLLKGDKDTIYYITKDIHKFEQVRASKKAMLLLKLYRQLGAFFCVIIALLGVWHSNVPSVTLIMLYVLGDYFLPLLLNHLLEKHFLK